MQKPITLTDYIVAHAAALQQSGHPGTARHYRQLVRNLQTYLAGGSWPLAATDRHRIQCFATYLAARGISRNTLSAYLRPLRAILRRAAGQVLLRYDATWFAEIYMGADRTLGRALSRTDMVGLARLDLSDDGTLARVRDLFMFSFYAMGMPFVDMAHLTGVQLTADAITYRRRKTGQLISVPLDARLNALIHRLRPVGSPWLLPILPADTAAADSHKAYATALRTYNRQLKQLAVRAGLATALTSYTARHTWATMARDAEVPISLISAGMGHTNERTTRIYLAGVDTAALAAANARVAGLIG